MQIILDKDECGLIYDALFEEREYTKEMVGIAERKGDYGEATMFKDNLDDINTLMNRFKPYVDFEVD